MESYKSGYYFFIRICITVQ